MDFEESDGSRAGLSGAGPLPPDDWETFGRKARMEALYAAHRPQLARFFKGRAQPQDVGDLIQEVFSRFAGRGRFAALIERPGAYLVTAARNLIAERARADDRHLTHHHFAFDDEESHSANPHDALEARDLLRRVENAIATLPAATREIFLLHRFEDLSYPEIARIKGISVKTVESHMTKALAKVRRAGTPQA